MELNATGVRGAVVLLCQMVVQELIDVQMVLLIGVNQLIRIHFVWMRFFILNSVVIKN